MSRGGLVLFILASLMGVARAESLVQEERDVTVDGHAERWRLEWRAAPHPLCDQKADARDIRCKGFVHGLSGSLDLVRLEGAQEVDRLPLTPLFRYGIWGDESGPKEARFQPTAISLSLGDYDHDGRAAEFVLQLDATSLGLEPSLLVGLDAKTHKLKAFATTEHPERPLVLPLKSLWEQLHSKPRVDKRISTCAGGSKYELVMHLSTDATGLHVIEEAFDCEKAVPVPDYPSPMSTIPAPQHFASNLPKKAVLREERIVEVDGHRELWQIVWKDTPKPYSINPDDDTLYGNDRMNAEVGDADLIRFRDGQEIDRLALRPIFNGLWGKDGSESSNPVLLRHWPYRNQSQDTSEQVWERPPIVLMALGDYDHDGQATEFVLPAERFGTSHYFTALVGLDAKSRKLKAFRSTKKPTEIVYLGNEYLWEPLLKSSEVSEVETLCGDHGAEETTIVHLRATNGVLRVWRTPEPCPKEPQAFAPSYPTSASH